MTETNSAESWCGTIGELARRAGVGVETVRFYQRKGLLAQPVRPPGGVRRYGEEALARLCFIRAAQGLGFSLREVAGLLRLADGTQCAEARSLAQDKLVQVRDRLRALAAMEQALAQLVQQCAEASGSVRCPLISALGRAERARAG